MAVRRTVASSLLLLAGTAAAGEVDKIDLNATGRIVADIEDSAVLDDDGNQHHSAGDAKAFGLNITGKVHMAGTAGTYNELKAAADTDFAHRTKELLQVRARSGSGLHAKTMENIARTLNRGVFLKDSSDTSKGGAGKDVAETEPGKAEKQKKAANNFEKLKAMEEATNRMKDEEVPGVVKSVADTGKGEAVTVVPQSKERQAKIDKLRDHAKLLSDWAEKLLGVASGKVAQAATQRSVKLQADRLALDKRESLAPILDHFLRNGLLAKTTRDYMKECRNAGGEEGQPQSNHTDTMNLCSEAEDMRVQINKLIQEILGSETAYVRALENAQGYVLEASEESVSEPPLPECFETCKAEDDAQVAQAEKDAALRKLDELEGSAQELSKKVDSISFKESKDGTTALSRWVQAWKAVMHYMLEEFIGRRAVSEKVRDPKVITEAHAELKDKLRRMKEYVETFLPQSLGGLDRNTAKEVMQKLAKKVQVVVQARSKQGDHSLTDLWTEALRLSGTVNEVLPDGLPPNLGELPVFLDQLQTLMSKCSSADRSILGGNLPRAGDVFTMKEDMKKFGQSFFEDAIELMTYKIQIAKTGEVAPTADVNKEVADTSPLTMLDLMVQTVAKRQVEGADLTKDDFDQLTAAMVVVAKQLPFDGTVKRQLRAVSDAGDDAGDKLANVATDMEAIANKDGRNAAGMSEESLREKARELRAHAAKLTAQADKMIREPTYEDQTSLDTLAARAVEYSVEAAQALATAGKLRRLGKFGEADRLEEEANSKLAQSSAIKETSADQAALKKTGDVSGDKRF